VAELFTKGGLPYEASVGGQKFKFFPLKNYARFDDRLDLYRLWIVTSTSKALASCRPGSDRCGVAAAL
jgi:hypothetical protein